MKKLILSTATIALLTLSLVNTGCKKTDADTTKPVITVVGSNPYYIQKSTTYTDPGATANDDVDGAVLASTSDVPVMSTSGTYTITYTAKDKAGNTATSTRTVYVVDINRTGTSVVDESPYVTGGVPQGTLTPYTEPSIQLSTDGAGKVTVQKFGGYSNGVVNFKLTGFSTLSVPTTDSILCGSTPTKRVFTGSGTLNATQLIITFDEFVPGSSIHSQDRYTL